MAEREELKSLLMKVNEESEKVGLKLNMDGGATGHKESDTTERLHFHFHFFHRLIKSA